MEQTYVPGQLNADFVKYLHKNNLAFVFEVNKIGEGIKARLYVEKR